jgi:hypothetical protein
MVGMKGLEPSRLATPGPKPGVSTNSTTSPVNRGILLDFTVKNQLGVAVIFAGCFFHSFKYRSLGMAGK